MNLVCSGHLALSISGYCRACLNKLFFGRKVSHVLPFNSNDIKLIKALNSNKKLLSISGVQEKYLLTLEKNKLRFINKGEMALYILKPAPVIDKKANQLPANEHLTMQIASQIFNIETAINAIIWFKDCIPAYLTKRFDFNTEFKKVGQEDFASLAQKTSQTHGSNYKYQGNYLELFELLKKYCAAYPIESIKLYKLIVFNFLFSNGDAHLKNFSISETDFGDYKLSPAYDLLNTRIHVKDSDFALEGGLLPKNLTYGNIKKQFQILGKEAGINAHIVSGILHDFSNHKTKVKLLIAQSFLDEKTKRQYLQHYERKLSKLL